MSTLDLALSLLVVAAAAGFLVWQLAVRRQSSRRRARDAHEDSGANVVLDDKLARALAKANARKAATDETPLKGERTRSCCE